MASITFFLAGENVKRFEIKLDNPGLIMGNLSWFGNTPISMAIFAPGQTKPMFEKNGIKSLDFSQVVTKESLLSGNTWSLMFWNLSDSLVELTLTIQSPVNARCIPVDDEDDL